MNIGFQQTTLRGELPKERGACGVMTLAAILMISPRQAQGILEAFGRKPRSGTPLKVWRKIGLETRPDLACRTLESIMPEMAKGRFAIWHANHFFAVIDGVVRDWRKPKPGLRVKMVYQAS